MNLADKVVLFGAPPHDEGAPIPSTGWVPRLELGPRREDPTRCVSPPSGGGRRPRIESQKREKPPRGATPGGLRIRLLMKETVRGPLGGSLLLGIGARIERPHVGKRSRGHAAARLAGERTHDAIETDEERARAIARMPPCAWDTSPRAIPLERTTEHGEARLRLRFRQFVL